MEPEASQPEAEPSAGDLRGTAPQRSQQPPPPAPAAAPETTPAGGDTTAPAVAAAAAVATGSEGGAEAAVPDTKALAKRMVALHVGYVGTGYKGSSVNRSLGDDATVEQVLERAIFRAGFMKAENYGAFAKVRWTRASRTDKGVHSLGTVVSLKLLVHDARFTSMEDAEGLSHADAINAHLPPSVRVFTVQRCHKKFNARHHASSRVYEYYLPSSLLELKGDGCQDDVARIALFRRALSAFLGNHAFHNFTKMKAHAGERTRAKNYNTLRADAMAAARQRGDDPRIDASEIKDLLRQHEQGVKKAVQDQPAAPAADGGTVRCVDASRAAAEVVAEPEPTGGPMRLVDGRVEASTGATQAAAGEAAAEGRVAAEDAAAAVGNPEAAPAAAPEDSPVAAPNHTPAAGPPAAAPGNAAALTPVACGAVAPSGSEPGAAQPAAAAGAAPVHADTAVQPLAPRSEPSGKRPRGGGGGSDGDDGDDDDEDGEGGELDDEDDAAGDSAAGGGGGGGGAWRGDGCLEWTADDPSAGREARVTQTFYRRIYSFDAADPVPLVPGGTPCLRLTVHGQSFMLHHIRHMIGSAVAVAVGLLPMELLAASLAAPSRVTLPRAPPHTLLLSDCRFHPFPHSTGTDNGLREMTGERLSLRARGTERKEAFRRDVLQPALEGLVGLPEWTNWLASVKKFAAFEPARVEEFLRQYREWLEARKAKRAKRAEEQAAWTGADGECEGDGDGDGERGGAGDGEQAGRGGYGGGRHGRGGGQRGWRGGRGGGRRGGGRGGDPWWKKRKQGG